MRPITYLASEHTSFPNSKPNCTKTFPLEWWLKRSKPLWVSWDTLLMLTSLLIICWPQGCTIVHLYRCWFMTFPNTKHALTIWNHIRETPQYTTTIHIITYRFAIARILVHIPCCWWDASLRLHFFVFWFFTYSIYLLPTKGACSTSINLTLKGIYGSLMYLVLFPG